MNKRSRKRKLTSSHPHADSDTIFTLLLASLSNPNPNSNTNSLIKNCLNNFPLSKHQIIPIPILSLLPVLLTSNYDDAIVCRTAEIVGQASLLSLEMNEQLALDCDIVKCLVSVLAAAMFKRKDVSVRVCNAVLDLSTTSLGRERLLQFSALETLIWEGFAHIALYCWNQTQKQTHQASVESLSGILDVMSVNLLHVMIGLFGESDPIFRKACLVAAISLQQGTNDWLHLNQKIIFNHVITRISKSRFSDAFLSGEMAIKKNEDPFQRMRWIRLLSQERKTIDEYDGHTPLMGMGNLLPVYAEQKETAELAFNLVKSKFCCEVLFEDVIGSYLMLLEKYKKARKQYGDGMLSLHL